MWQDAYLESRVLSADPVELIRLVYGYAIDSVKNARRFLTAGDIAGRSQAISRAIAAISELDGSLNHNLGAEVSRNLAELYAYIRQKLTEGNVRQSDGPLAEAEALLGTLAAAWDGVSASTAPDAAASVPAALACVWSGETEFRAHGWNG